MFQVNDIMKELMATMNQSNLEKALLLWCQQNTEVTQSHIFMMLNVDICLLSFIQFSGY